SSISIDGSSAATDELGATEDSVASSRPSPSAVAAKAPVPAAPPPPAVSSAPAPQPAPASLSGMEQQLLGLHNAERSRIGAQPLRIDGGLRWAAHQRAADMAANGYFGQTSP